MKHFWTIRRRLTLWYGGVLALVLVLFGATVYFVMSRQLLERIDVGLDEELADVVGEVGRAQDRAEMLLWLNRRFAHHEGFDFQITNEAGERVFVSERPAARRPDLPPAQPGKETMYAMANLAEIGRYRIVSRRVVGPEGPLTVQVARSLASYDHELAELLAVLLIAGPLTLGIAISGGYFLARRALVPVDLMTQTANQIDARRMGRRIEIVHPADELGRLATTLNGMLDRLQRSFQEMQRFTADASHELRTPLSIIRTEAELALAKPIGDAEKQELLGNILEECQRLTWITDQLLTLCRDDSGIASSSRERVDLALMSRQVAETMKLPADSKQQTFACFADESAVVTGDVVRLRHMIYNLLDNAIKYSPTGGRIELFVQANGNHVRLIVADDGIGISPEHLPHIFERFYRVDKSRTRAEGGTGLGLSIVQSIVTAHGGQVDVQSEPGRGTSFTVTLPKDEPKTEDECG
jgi:heavy metal sensor kinase